MACEIDRDCYLKATPAGAYFCMASEKDELARDFLKVILKRPSTPLLNNNTVESLFSVESSTGLRVLQHLQKVNWLEFLENESSVDDAPISQQLDKLLPNLSLSGKVLLADSQGAKIASVGFSHDASEELSGMSSDILSFQKRHKWLLNDKLKYSASNWGVVDAAGYSQLGFWPLYLGEEVFSLVISGVPRLTSDAFLTLSWLLHTQTKDQNSSHNTSKIHTLTDFIEPFPFRS